MKQWLSRMKLAHKMVLGFLGLIALPFTLLSVFSFASVASHYEHQLAQDGQYMLNMVVSDVNEKMDHVEMLMQVLSCNQNLIAFLSHDYNGAVSHEEYTQTVMPLLQGASNASTGQNARGRVVPRVRNAATEWCGPIPTG